MYEHCFNCYTYAGELDKIEVNVRDFDAGSSNVLVISFTKNGLTAQSSITFTGECVSTMATHGGMDGCVNC